MWSINPGRKELVDLRVRVKATNQIGTVANVMPGADGTPWSLHVRLDDEAYDAPPTIVAPDEVSALDPLN